MADFADLVQKELRLARAEIGEKLATKVRAGAWMIVAAILGFVAILLLMAGLVIWISTLGISLPGACLLVAAATAVLATIAYYAGRDYAREGLAPERTIHQVNRDIQEAKETLS
jgi:membrane protein implicated in regulation of membrane protease activity